MDDKQFLSSLNSGEARVVTKVNGEWIVNIDVKQKILDIFRTNEIIEIKDGYRDKKPLTPRSFSEDDYVRMVPNGSTVREGAHIGKNVVIMAPSYVNIGAYVDSGSMLDSHSLVGSCAFVGKNVHVSAGVQIGGVLEPMESSPVIIEDDCFIGAGVVIVSGILIRNRAVIAAGVVLSASIPVYDVVNNTVHKGEIPEGAVVVPGNRKIKDNIWAEELGLTTGCAIIVKYRDSKTSAAVALNENLR